MHTLPRRTDPAQGERTRRYKTTDIPVAFLAECLILDQETTSGLRWRERPREHFVSARASASWNARYAGKLAGSPTIWGYLDICLTFAGRERHLKAHRVVWALAHGRWPDDQLVHRF